MKHIRFNLLLTVLTVNLVSSRNSSNLFYSSIWYKPVLLLLLFCFQFSQAQSPGNVSGCSIWFHQTSNKVIESDIKKSDENNVLNFNNEKRITKEERIIIDRNKLKPTFTLFLVYKSNEEKERELLNYTVGNERLQISNKKTTNSSGMECSKYKFSEGVLLEYSSNLSAVKNSNICVLSFGATQEANQNEKEKTNILEFLFYPRVLSATEKLRVESYLSIKYGVSLIGEKNYLSSTNVKVWNKEDNKNFNNNVTGIARDDKTNLFQKQSGNSNKNGLYIGFGTFDSINKYTKKDIENNSYLVWGDNGKTNNLILDKSQDETINRMDQIWKIQKTFPKGSKTLPSFLLLDQNEFFQNNKKTTTTSIKNKSLWLVVSPSSTEPYNYNQSIYYPAKVLENKKLLFENITWDKDSNGSDSFTFIEAPNLFMTNELVAKNCNLSQNGKIKCKIIGGQSPFLLKVEHNGLVSNFGKSSREFEIEVLDLADYKITLVDSNKETYVQNITTESADGLNINVAPNWHLNDLSEVEIVSSLNTTDSKNIKFKWLKEDGSIISTDKTLKLFEQGNYSLYVKNDKGCTKSLPFNVSIASTNNPEILLYPNPAKSGEPFNLKFDLKQISDIQIKLYNINGELLKSQNINKISSYNYSDSLQVSGSYLIVVTTETSSMTYKLIIN